MILRNLFILALLMLSATYGLAQCAMCRTQVVNNVSQGDTSLAAGLNLGILYLFVTPYLAIATLAFLWYRNSKVNEGKRGLAGRFGM